MRLVVDDAAGNRRRAAIRIEPHRQQVRVIFRWALTLGYAQAALLGDDVGIDDRDVFFADGREQALDHRGLERSCVVVGDVAEVFDVNRLKLAIGELRRKGSDTL